ncbi:thiosulfate sulfurtransferase/rhodanese-like domain-containing protein 3 [Spea bombifrons]|uniref:thiosulfate sulfurtransferase/rhodanese-like domain-containing protein 3 n=1 Tax=Spea bombifrons TaxID=233779 RepID=UPI00234A034E|nr:thiosulfate sulfurtransferase/rhodanese-like domain-containing protein 3 [Spea bombifrons]
MSALLNRLCVSVRFLIVQQAPLGLRRSLHSGLGATIRSTCLGPRTCKQGLCSSWYVARGLSTSLGKTINYEELKDLLADESVVLIDVREPWEVKEYGIIKGSINIPLGDLTAALQMSPNEFQEKYQKNIPDKSSKLVFSCLAGIRSERALGVASSLGFSSIHNYGGGFEDWKRHEQPIKK